MITRFSASHVPVSSLNDNLRVFLNLKVVIVLLVQSLRYDYVRYVTMMIFFTNFIIIIFVSGAITPRPITRWTLGGNLTTHPVPVDYK